MRVFNNPSGSSYFWNYELSADRSCFEFLVNGHVEVTQESDSVRNKITHVIVLISIKTI